MNKIIKYSAIALVAVLAIYGVVKFFSGSQTASAVPYPSQLSSFPNGVQVGGGPFNQGLIQGGANSTSTTVTSYTLVSNDVVGFSSIILTPNTGATNLYLPASSTLSTWLPNPGDFTTFILLNGTTTAGVNGTIGLTAGSGTLLAVASSTGSTGITASTTAGKASEINVVRKTNSDLLFLVSPYF